jgi:hypothetical protein
MRWADLIRVDLRRLSLLEGARAALVTFVPLLALQAGGQQALGVLVGFGALFACFADTGPGYATRLRATATVAVGGGAFLALGAAFGRPVLVSAPAIFGAALLGGLTPVYGETAAAIGRILTLVFAVGFGLSLFNLPSLVGVYLLAGGLVTVLSVAVLALLVPAPVGEGRAPRGLAPLARQLTLRSPLLRYSLVRAAAVATAAAIAWTLPLPRPYWSAIPVIVTLRPQRSAAFLVIAQYLIGTLVGAGLAILLSTYVRGSLVRLAIAFALTFAAFAIRQINYGLFVAALIAMILLIVTLLAPSPIPVPDLRVIETLLGLSIASLVALAWGNRGAEPI